MNKFIKTPYLFSIYEKHFRRFLIAKIVFIADQNGLKKLVKKYNLSYLFSFLFFAAVVPVDFFLVPLKSYAKLYTSKNNTGVF